MKYKNIKPDLLNGSKQFRFLFRNIGVNDINDINNINNINNTKKDLKINNYDTSFYLNLMGIIFIIFFLAILFYKYTNKFSKKKQLVSFIQQVNDYSKDDIKENNNNLKK